MQSGSLVFTYCGDMSVGEKVIIVLSGIPLVYVPGLQDYRYKQKRRAAWHKLWEKVQGVYLHNVMSKILATFWALTHPLRRTRGGGYDFVQLVCFQRLYWQCSYTEFISNTMGQHAYYVSFNSTLCPSTGVMTRHTHTSQFMSVLTWHPGFVPVSADSWLWRWHCYLGCRQDHIINRKPSVHTGKGLRFLSVRDVKSQALQHTKTTEQPCSNQ